MPRTKKDTLKKNPRRKRAASKAMPPALATPSQPAAAPAEASVATKLPSAFKILLGACKVLLRHWKLFSGILLIYALLNLSLVGGVGGGDLQATKTALNHAFSGQFGQIGTGLTLFGFLVSASSGSSSSSVTGAYQALLLLVVSLALIWALRQVYASHATRIRDGFYSGMYPAIPFLLVLLVIGLELVPLLLGATLYTMLVNGGILIGLWEVALATIALFGLTVLSVWLVTPSVFALYVVTLPEMTPIKALRTARQLVRNRFWAVLRKLLFLPLTLLVVSAVIVVPVALFITPVSAALYFILTIIGVGVVHSYLYALYRELL